MGPSSHPSQSPSAQETLETTEVGDAENSTTTAFPTLVNSSSSLLFEWNITSPLQFDIILSGIESVQIELESLYDGISDAFLFNIEIFASSSSSSSQSPSNSFFFVFKIYAKCSNELKCVNYLEGGESLPRSLTLTVSASARRRLVSESNIWEAKLLSLSEIDGSSDCPIACLSKEKCQTYPRAFSSSGASSQGLDNEKEKEENDLFENIMDHFEIGIALIVVWILAIICLYAGMGERDDIPMVARNVMAVKHERDRMLRSHIMGRYVMHLDKMDNHFCALLINLWFIRITNFHLLCGLFCRNKGTNFSSRHRLLLLFLCFFLCMALSAAYVHEISSLPQGMVEKIVETIQLAFPLSLICCALSWTIQTVLVNTKPKGTNQDSTYLNFVDRTREGSLSVPPPLSSLFSTSPPPARSTSNLSVIREKKDSKNEETNRSREMGRRKTTPIVFDDDEDENDEKDEEKQENDGPPPQIPSLNPTIQHFRTKSSSDRMTNHSSPLSSMDQPEPAMIFTPPPSSHSQGPHLQLPLSVDAMTLPPPPPPLPPTSSASSHSSSSFHSPSPKDHHHHVMAMRPPTISRRKQSPSPGYHTTSENITYSSHHHQRPAPSSLLAPPRSHQSLTSSRSQSGHFGYPLNTPQGMVVVGGGGGGSHHTRSGSGHSGGGSIRGVEINGWECPACQRYNGLEDPYCPNCRASRPIRSFIPDGISTSSSPLPRENVFRYANRNIPMPINSRGNASRESQVVNVSRTMNFSPTPSRGGGGGGGGSAYSHSRSSHLQRPVEGGRGMPMPGSSHSHSSHLQRPTEETFRAPRPMQRNIEPSNENDEDDDDEKGESTSESEFEEARERERSPLAVHFRRKQEIDFEKKLEFGRVRNMSLSMKNEAYDRRRNSSSVPVVYPSSHAPHSSGDRGEREREKGNKRRP